VDKQPVIFEDLGVVDYKSAWDYQESLLQQNVAIKTAARLQPELAANKTNTKNYFLICEHSPVYTIGKSGNTDNILMPVHILKEKGIGFYTTNRGGDITFHGLQQLVGYPILDLEKYYNDIGKYLRNLEEVIILTIAAYGVQGERSAGETGVWIDAGIKGRARKICAIGVRCSRWITMHGFALNVNTDLAYFNNIVPCGIQGKQVTSLEKECGRKINYDEVKDLVKKNFEKIVNSSLQ
jgi:lipoyl(octanoyl) transferase